MRVGTVWESLQFGSLMSRFHKSHSPVYLPPNLSLSINWSRNANFFWLVGGFNHLEKYDFVNGKDYPFFLLWKIKHVPNHQLLWVSPFFWNWTPTLTLEICGYSECCSMFPKTPRHWIEVRSPQHRCFPFWPLEMSGNIPGIISGALGKPG